MIKKGGEKELPVEQRRSEVKRRVVDLQVTGNVSFRWST